jgi:hypothetical protein
MSAAERQCLHGLDALQIRDRVEVAVNGHQHVKLRVLHHCGVHGIPSTEAGVRLQEAASFDDVVSCDGEGLGDQLGRGANGACGVGHAHAARPNVQDLLEDLAASDAVELSLSDGLKDVTARRSMRAITTDAE